ncbi:Assimilatory sulfite reductase [Tolypocladium capitatum]|uniref:Assimilatory sulfite reductase n=1 Tax=Tolypocladium capitatum TaxID=45235 RepID=A0A2K3Q9Q7_9HYPO|nr:Assimilatory sulfite reductase [Tolypocladium capitatum]
MATLPPTNDSITTASSTSMLWTARPAFRWRACTAGQWEAAPGPARHGPRIATSNKRRNPSCVPCVAPDVIVFVVRLVVDFHLRDPVVAEVRHRPRAVPCPRCRVLHGCLGHHEQLHLPLLYHHVHAPSDPQRLLQAGAEPDRRPEVEANDKGLDAARPTAPRLSHHDLFEEDLELRIQHIHVPAPEDLGHELAARPEHAEREVEGREEQL